MAAFKFQKSEFSSTSQEDWGFETVGVLSKIPAMKGKRITFTKKNLKGEARVTLQIFPKVYTTLKDAIEADQVEKLSCTVPLSKIVRKGLASGVTHNKMLSYLTSLEIQKDVNDESKYFLFQEKGDGEALPNFLIEELSKEAVTLEDVMF
jgi:hypothetical protein